MDSLRPQSCVSLSVHCIKSIVFDPVAHFTRCDRLHLLIELWVLAKPPCPSLLPVGASVLRLRPEVVSSDESQMQSHFAPGKSSQREQLPVRKGQG